MGTKRDKPPPDATNPGPQTRQLGGDAAHAATSIRQIHVKVTVGPDAGAAVTSTKPQLVIGTHDGCDLVLHDDAVSRFHCELRIDDDRVVLVDLDSRNGTRVNGIEVGVAYPRSGTTIAIGRTQLSLDLGTERAEIPHSEHDRFGLLVGSSVPMRRVFATLERASASDATVLLEGETGTGKEVAAESIHRESKRASGPFVVVDCGSIPRELLESELFGHERGAFTGAVAARGGAFEAANGGTIFLDEIGELSADLQPKLLRALEKREIKRVGHTRYMPVDVRVVAATNRELRAEVNQGRFRSDLFYRLAVVEVRLPPLRERLDDLPQIVDRILAAIGASPAAVTRLTTPDFLAELATHRWPGNVRELRNYLERCLALDATVPLPDERGSAGAGVDLSVPLKVARERWLAPLEREYVAGLLRRHDGNITAAARDAGIDRITFYRLLWRLGLREPDSD